MAEGFTDSLLRPSAAPLQSQEPLSIEQVRVRALTHNSEYARSQAQLLETVRKAGVRGKELLPTAYANSYGTWRNNTSASVGEKVNETNSDAAREFYTAQDQGVAISNYTASWDLLELGLSSFKSNRRKINAIMQGGGFGLDEKHKLVGIGLSRSVVGADPFVRGYAFLGNDFEE